MKLPWRNAPLQRGCRRIAAVTHLLCQAEHPFAGLCLGAGLACQNQVDGCRRQRSQVRNIFNGDCISVSHVQ